MSLSDRLTPWKVIEKACGRRQSDFALCLYNPASTPGRTICNGPAGCCWSIAREIRSADWRAISRPGEATQFLTLTALADARRICPPRSMWATADPRHRRRMVTPGGTTVSAVLVFGGTGEGRALAAHLAACRCAASSAWRQRTGNPPETSKQRHNPAERMDAARRGTSFRNIKRTWSSTPPTYAGDAAPISGSPARKRRGTAAPGAGKQP